VVVDLTGHAGRLEAVIDLPVDGVRAAVVLAHPHPEFGGSMRSRVVHEAMRGLTRAGCAVLRFNFRGVGTSEGHFTGGDGEVRDMVTAIAFVRGQYPDVPIWAAGYSFGAWVAMGTGAKHPDVSALIGIAPPLGTHDFSMVPGAGKPVFLIHGEDDDVIDVREVRRFYATLPEPRELVVIGHADHAFDGQAGEIGDALFELLSDFSA
jgi:alpha/beta superfamily hydrolase